MTTLTPKRIQQIIEENIDPMLYPRKMRIKHTDINCYLNITKIDSKNKENYYYSFNLSLYTETGTKVDDVGTFFILPCKHEGHQGIDIAWYRNGRMVNGSNGFVDIETKKNIPWDIFRDETALDACKAIAQEQGNYTICDSTKDHSIAKYQFYLCADE